LNKILLPNLRFLSLPSGKSGQDWSELAHRIDNFALENGYELSEESVFLTFDRIPAALAVGEGNCSVSRPVIGPLKELPGEFWLEDWTQKNVFQMEVEKDSWQELWDKAQEGWEELQRNGEKLGTSFLVRLSRRLGPDLTLKMHIYYHA
jgi:hypothetical protein